MFQVSTHAVEQYLDRFLGLKEPYSADQMRLGREKLQDLVKDMTRISLTDFVRPMPYLTTKVWAGRDWSGTKIYLFVDDDEVITVLRDTDYTTRHRMIDGKRKLVSKGPRYSDPLRIPKCPVLKDLDRFCRRTGR